MINACDLNWELILKYLNALASWPIATLIIVFYVAKKFHDPISLWIKNLQVKHGDTTFSSSQPVELKKDVDLKEQQNKPKDTPTALEGSPIANADELKDLALKWRENAYIWEYKYLNLFFVTNTKIVLQWIYSVGSGNFATYSNLFSEKIPSVAERQAILAALENHFLIVFQDNGKIEITEKGKEYVEVMLDMRLNSDSENPWENIIANKK